jgi:hypothetical protein
MSLRSKPLELVDELKLPLLLMEAVRTQVGLTA